MRILVLGAGAIGGYFGGRLQQAGSDVTFLVRPQRRTLLAANGITIKSPCGDYQAPVKAITADEIDGPFDAILLTCKSYDLEGAIDAIRPALGAQTAILPLLNGISHVERLNAEFGSERVLGGAAKILVGLKPDGSIEHTMQLNDITFGEQTGEMTDRVTALANAFPADSVTAEAVPNIMQKMWEKVVHLCTTAGLCSLMRATVGEIASAPGGTETLIRLLEVNAEIAAKEGYRPTEEFMEHYRDWFHDTSLAYTPSLLRDIERHNPIEGDHIVGFMRERAHKHGIDPTLHDLIYMSLKAYETRRANNRW